MIEESLLNTKFKINDDVIIGEKLRKCREATQIDGKKLTRPKLSSEIGFTEIKIKNQETGRTEISIHDIALYAAYYNKSIDYFLYDFDFPCSEVSENVGLSKESNDSLMEMTLKQKDYMNRIIESGLAPEIIKLMEKYLLSDGEKDVLNDDILLNVLKQRTGHDYDAFVNDYKTYHDDETRYSLAEKAADLNQKSNSIKRRFASLEKEVSDITAAELERIKKTKEDSDLFWQQIDAFSKTQSLEQFENLSSERTEYFRKLTNILDKEAELDAEIKAFNESAEVQETNKEARSYVSQLLMSLYAKATSNAELFKKQAYELIDTFVDEQMQIQRVNQIGDAMSELDKMQVMTIYKYSNGGGGNEEK